VQFGHFWLSLAAFRATCLQLDKKIGCKGCEKSDLLYFQTLIPARKCRLFYIGGQIRMCLFFFAGKCPAKRSSGAKKYAHFLQAKGLDKPPKMNRLLI
jgi:hypothetical protein